MPTSLTRRVDWPERLSDCLGRWQQVPFDWGVADCGCLAADAVEAITGRDLMGDLRGQYSDGDSAWQAIRAAGHHSLYHLMLKSFGKPVTPAFARPGDIALDHGVDGPSLGVVNGRRTAFLGVIRLPQETREHAVGLIFEPTSAMRHIFKVGA